MGPERHVAVRIGRPQANELAGVAELERREQHVADDAEDRAGGADTQGQRKHRHHREDRAPSHEAERVAHVLRELGPPLAPLARLVQCHHIRLRAMNVAKAPPRFARRVRFAHSAGNELIPDHRQVRGDLVLYVPIDRLAPVYHTASNTRDTAAAYRCQTEIRAASCFRPAAVNA